MGFWTDKRVIVTGGGGFLGSVVVEKLEARGSAEVIVPRSKDYDLREVDAVRALLDETTHSGERSVDIIVHLAARVGGIGENRAHPAEYFYDNLTMGTHLLHEAWRAGVGRFLTAGTVCAYPKFTPAPFREEDLWAGYPEETNAPYGMAKKALLVQSQTYRQQYDFDAIFLLLVNLYGPRDNFDLESSHVIPALIRKCFEAKENACGQIVGWGDGSPTREFLYVEDAAEAIVLATEKYSSAQPVNIGSGEEVSIEELTNTVARIVGFEGTVSWDTSKPNGQPRRLLDTRRAEREFGFKATTRLEGGLRRTIAWYAEHRDDSGGRIGNPNDVGD